MSLKTTKPSHREGFRLIGAAGFEPTTPTTPKLARLRKALEIR